jgi:hypothetical protein
MIKDGKIEEIEEIVESDKPSEYDEDGNKLPKKKNQVKKNHQKKLKELKNQQQRRKIRSLKRLWSMKKVKQLK